MTRSLIVIGAGGHAKVVIGALLRAGLVPLGALDADPAKRGTSVLGVPVLGGDESLDHYPPDAVELVNGIGSVGVPALRRRVQETLSGRGYRFAAVIDPAAVVGAECHIQAGAQVLARAVVQPGCRLGTGCIVNSGAVVDHDCRIGDFVHIAPGAILSGEVDVADDAHVGTGAAIIQGIRIGSGALVAAGAAVVADVAPGQRVGGVPARAF